MDMNLTATVLVVDNLETCRAFYQDMLGLKPTFTDDVSTAYRMGEHDFVLLTVPAAIDMVGDNALGQGSGHRTMPCIGVKDVDAVYTEMTAKGVTFLKPPKSQNWGRRTAYFADPEGNLWELWHPIPEAPQ